MRGLLKWVIAAVILLAGVGFLAFLYYVPPLTNTSPEEFVKAVDAGAPAIEDISDPAQRLLAERGKYITTVSDCLGCHQTPGQKGPDPTRYLAGGVTFVSASDGKVITRNLSPDRETGLGGVTDEEILRVLRSGIHRSGRQISPALMPWALISNLTDEDLHAVIVYLRHLKPVPHAIPDPVPGAAPPAGAIEQVYSTRDAGKPPGR